MKKLLLLYSFSALFTLQVLAQEEKTYINQVWGTTKLINQTTTKLIPKKSYTFNIQHRFGATRLDEEFLKNFMGLDLSSNIRFAFNVPLGERLYIGIGRTKFDKLYDVSVNYSIIRQTTNNSQPFSLSLFTYFSYLSADLPAVDETWTFDDGSPFEYNNSHRISYFGQLSISRKFNSWFSAQLTPSVAHRNLAIEHQNNSYLAIPLGTRFKVGMSSSILVEQAFIMNKTGQMVHPFAIAYEIATVGHSFQITLSSSNQLLLHELYSKEALDITKGDFYLGFNIFRTFYVKR
jgi:hypothetical protein